MGKLLQDRKYEKTLPRTRQKHTIQTSYMYLETLENGEEKREEPYKVGNKPPMGMVDGILREEISVCMSEGAMNVAVTKERLPRFGLVSMLDYYTERCVTC